MLYSLMQTMDDLSRINNLIKQIAESESQLQQAESERNQERIVYLRNKKAQLREELLVLRKHALILREQELLSQKGGRGRRIARGSNRCHMQPPCAVSCVVTVACQVTRVHIRRIELKCINRMRLKFSFAFVAGVAVTSAGGERHIHFLIDKEPVLVVRVAGGTKLHVPTIEKNLKVSLTSFATSKAAAGSPADDQYQPVMTIMTKNINVPADSTDELWFKATKAKGEHPLCECVFLRHARSVFSLIAWFRSGLPWWATL
jgi:hypothetical protein